MKALAWAVLGGLWVGCSGAAGPPPRPPVPRAPAPPVDERGDDVADEEPSPASAPSPWTTEAPTPWVVEPLPRAGGAAPTRAPSRIELRLPELPTEIGVAPDGALWLTTRDGAAVRTSGFGAPWQPVAALVCKEPDDLVGMGGCDRVSFFDTSTAIATGYLGRNRDQLVRTVDGGRSWQRLRFASGGEWIYDVFVGPGDEAWMGGSSGRLHHSADRGGTWAVVATPFDSRQRLHRIFMAAGGRGIVGALDNALRVTADGGRTWTAIPTPLDQRATSGAVIDEQEDDRIDAVALFGGGLLVAQNERVYASAADPVRWRPLPDLVALAVDRAGRAAYGVIGDGRFARIDAAQSVTPIPGARVRGALVAFRAEDGVLYAMDEASGLYRADAGTVRSSTLQADGDPSGSLSSVRRAGDALWGVSPHGLYTSRDGGATWAQAWSSEAPLRGVEARSERELFVWSDRGATTFDARTRRATPVTALADAAIQRVVVAGSIWLALAATGPDASTWRSGDAGATWERIDRWTGWSAHDAASLPDGSVLTWTWDGFVRRGGQAVPAIDIEVPCCSALYFASATEGFLRGYVHHAGDHVWATDDAGATWAPAGPSALPFIEVTPFGTGALGVVGHSFSNEDDDRRELFLLQGLTRRLVFRSPEAISDVTVDPDGRVLLELDPSPETYADTAGRYWVWVHP